MLTRRNLISALLALLVGVLTASAQRPDSAPDTYFVSFREPVTDADLTFLTSQGIELGNRFPEVRAVEVVIRNPLVLAVLQRSSRVEFVEQVPMRYASDLSQQQLVPDNTNGLYGLVATKAVNVQALGITGTGVKVGVADTAIDCTHQDLVPNLIQSVDRVGRGRHGGCWKQGDLNEDHATHVAGTIVGVFNQVGVFGVAYNAQLYHARVLGPNGGTSSWIMDGVRYLVDEAQVRVVNLSLGGSRFSRIEERFYNSVRRKGVLVVASSGNEAAGTVSYPAAYASNIAVGAVDRNNALASFSNNGENLDVVAPGVGVISSVPRGEGTDASVSTSSGPLSAVGAEFAGRTNASGITGTLVNCGQALVVTDCSASVFGNIALIQRGGINFSVKIANVMLAGAAAAIIYNNVPGDLIATLGTPTNNGLPWIPVVGVSDTIGATLLASVGATVTLRNIATDWAVFDGTSMAAPHVAGTIALMWSAAPNLSANAIENNLFNTCTDLGDAGYDTKFGHGAINALAAVQASMNPTVRR